MRQERSLMLRSPGNTSDRGQRVVRLCQAYCSMLPAGQTNLDKGAGGSLEHAPCLLMLALSFHSLHISDPVVRVIGAWHHTPLIDVDDLLRAQRKLYCVKRQVSHL